MEYEQKRVGGIDMRPAFAAIINTLQESDWVMDRVAGTLSAPAQAIDMNKKKAIKPDYRKRMKKAMHKHINKKGTPIAAAGTKITDPSK